MEFRRQSKIREGTAWNIQNTDLLPAISSPSLKSVRKRISLTHANIISSRWHAAEQHTLPPYEPEKDVEKAREMGKKNKNLPFISIFRYSTFMDKILMFIGVLLALCSGLLIPWIFYWVGKLLLEILLDVRCAHNRALLTDPLHPNFHTKISYDFLVNTGYGTAFLFICNYLSWRCFALAADRQVKRLSYTYFEWIIRKDMSWFDSYVDHEFSHSMTEDITQIRAGIGEKLPALISLLTTEIVLAILAFALDYRLALSFFGLAPICLLLAVLGSYAASRQTEAAAKSYKNAGNLAEEILCNIKIVKIYQGEPKELSRFMAHLESMTNIELKWITFAGACSASVGFLVYSIMGACIWFGSSTIDLGHGFCEKLPEEIHSSEQRGFHFINLEISFPEGPHSFVMVFMAIVSISIHAMEIPYFIRDIREALRKAAEVLFLIDWKPRIDNLSEDGKIPKVFAIGRIEINNLGFKYPRNPTMWAIRNISVSIYPGQIIGLVGRQSSGKSTLLKLLLRLYDPCEGQILFDGYNAQNYNVRWLRSQIALITQEPIVFPGTIEENLRYVKQNASMDDIHEACKRAHIHSRIIELPLGYKTVITPHIHANEMTINELRKLCVARALLYKPRIFLLDDPILGNDEDIQSILASCISSLHTHSTIIMTSSRANAFIKRCDQVYFFQDGLIQEHGTHLELLKNEGAYHKMIEETLDVIVGMSDIKITPRTSPIVKALVRD